MFGRRMKSERNPLPYRLDPFDPIDRHEMENSERQHVIPGGKTECGLIWARVFGISIPVGLRVGVSGGYRFGKPRKPRLRNK